MQQHIHKTQIASKDIPLQNAAVQLKDNRPQSIILQQQSAALINKQDNQEPIQKKANATGLPEHLKTGIEQLSGYAMDDVKVHYNSLQPAQLNAHAYAQGNQIHVASGQEKHLPHEAWHVVQQKQGRVKPTIQMKDRVNVNDDKGLEHEADIMGARALRVQTGNASQQKYSAPLQPKMLAKTVAADTTLQPTWVKYNLGNILMWDKKMEGIRWYYVVAEHLMYFVIESPDDLKKALRIPIDEDDEDSVLMNRYRASAGMSNSASRAEWMSKNLFGREDREPEPAPVVDIEHFTKITTELYQPLAFAKLQSLESKVSSGGILSAPVEDTSLFHILKTTASQLSMSVWEMELHLGSPSGYYNSFKADKANAGKAMGMGFASEAVKHLSNFVEYTDFLIKERKLTGSCGQTSAWLHQITGGLMGATGGQETPLLVKDFLEVLINHKSRPFYMRVLTGGHSFIIESTGSTMAIYQSWHGSAPMALMLEPSSLTVRSPSSMIAELTAVLMPKNSSDRDDERDARSKSLFYGQDHKDPTPMVWFNLNLNPLKPSEIHKNIVLSLHKYASQWEYALAGRDMEHMDIAANAVDLGPESPPKDMGIILATARLHSEVHKGLTNLHQEQMELLSDPDAFKPAKVVVPKAEEVYNYTINHAHSIALQFTITEADFEGSDPVSNTIGGIMRGKLKPGEYVFKATGQIYTLTKTDTSGKIGYIFTLKK